MIPTKPIGSIPRPPKLVAAITALRSGSRAQPELEADCAAAVATSRGRGSHPAQRKRIGVQRLGLI